MIDSFQDAEDLNIGDYVTQSDNFYQVFEGTRMHTTVIGKSKDEDIILEHTILFTNKNKYPNDELRMDSTFWQGYFKKDIKVIRKQKLKKIYESSNNTHHMGR